MRKFLLLTSLLCLCCAGYGQLIGDRDGATQKYTVELSFRKTTVSGLCYVHNSEEEINGSLVNEFGIKFFDFQHKKNKKKTVLKNVIGKLNKWYIKRIVKADINFLLTNDSVPLSARNRTCTIEQGRVTLCNNKYNLTYKFNPLNEATR